MQPLNQARLAGLAILLIGLCGTVYNWYSVITEGVYWVKSSFLFPFFACLGLSMVLYPTTRAENMRRYGREQIRWTQMPRGQKLLLVAGVLLGAAQWAFFSGLMSG